MRNAANTTTNSQLTNNQAVNEIIAKLNNGVIFQNDVANYQFVLRDDGTMLRYQNFKFTF